MRTERAEVEDQEGKDKKRERRKYEEHEKMWTKRDSEQNKIIINRRGAT